MLHGLSCMRVFSQKIVRSELEFLPQISCFVAVVPPGVYQEDQASVSLDFHCLSEV